MDSSAFIPPTYAHLNPEGYHIEDAGLSEENLITTRDTILENANKLIFLQQGFKVPSEEATKLFFDSKLRKKELGPEAERIIWRNGNTLHPIIQKTTGMVHIHFNPIVLENIVFNPRLYEISSKVHGTPHLAFRSGPERVSIKGKGSTIMPQHIDANLFDPSVNYNFRIQSLVVLDIDENVAPNKNGSLAVLIYFHHYWEFVGALCHPVDGFSDCKFPANASRFFKLPTGKKSFDKYYLPRIKKYASAYADFLEGRTCEEDKSSFLEFFERSQ